ncbi:hypothetical protein Nmel_005803 [Mimus melanotis]
MAMPRNGSRLGRKVVSERYP